ncbi:hypothetical protein K440DRAFT_616435 [Wilcoxina mikolae CBS 423.85]|nr:hypothetical protein K440DRAFT_616435 [Wilcoxina mikolae CBS 423.85]
MSYSSPDYHFISLREEQIPTPTPIPFLLHFLFHVAFQRCGIWASSFVIFYFCVRAKRSCGPESGVIPQRDTRAMHPMRALSLTKVRSTSLGQRQLHSVLAIGSGNHHQQQHHRQQDSSRAEVSSRLSLDPKVRKKFTEKERRFPHPHPSPPLLPHL